MVCKFYACFYYHDSPIGEYKEIELRGVQEIDEVNKAVKEQVRLKYIDKKKPFYIKRIIEEVFPYYGEKNE